MLYQSNIENQSIEMIELIRLSVANKNSNSKLLCLAIILLTNGTIRQLNS